jgi:signal transduction histidine kinase
VSPDSTLLGLETAAHQLTREVVRTLPVTIASVALWDQPTYTLTVKAVSSPRPLPWPLAVGARVPLADAPWHRAVFEQQAPVHLDQSSPEQSMSATEASLSLIPHLRSVYLAPIRFGDELAGVLAVGEMRSRDRAPLDDEKRRRCQEILDEFLASSASTWEAGRLRRQVRAMSLLVQTVKHMLEVRSYDDLVACLGARVADWLGVQVRGLLLRATPGGGMETVGRWQMPERTGVGEADQLLMAVARATADRQDLVAIDRVADDPLDPLHATMQNGEAWTRVSLPLLHQDGLLGIACLYAETDLCLTSVELETFRWLAEVSAVWMRAVGLHERDASERTWLRMATWELATTQQRVLLQEALSSVVDRLASRLPERLSRSTELLGAPETSPVPWDRMAEVSTREMEVVITELLEAMADPAGTTLRSVEANLLVQWAVEVAKTRAESGSLAGAPIRVDFEPSAERLVVETSAVLVGALAHAIQNAVEAMPDGGRVHVRAHGDNGHVVVSVADEGPGLAEEHRPRAFDPLFSIAGRPHLGLGLSVVRGLARRHGAQVELQPGEAGGTTFILRLPAVSRA